MKILSSLNEYKYTVLISLISLLSLYYGYSYYSNIGDKIIYMSAKKEFLVFQAFLD